MGSIAHFEEDKKELAKEMHRLRSLINNYTNEGGVVMNWFESSLVSEVKCNQDQDLINLELKAIVHNERVITLKKKEMVY